MPVFELMDIAAIVLAELVRESNLEEGTADPCSSFVSFFFRDFSRTYLLKALVCIYLFGFLRMGNKFKIKKDNF